MKILKHLTYSVIQNITAVVLQVWPLASPRNLVEMNILRAQPQTY